MSKFNIGLAISVFGIAILLFLGMGFVIERYDNFIDTFLAQFPRIIRICWYIVFPAVLGAGSCIVGVALMTTRD